MENRTPVEEVGGKAMNTQERYLGSLAWAVDKIMEAGEQEMSRIKAERVKCPCLKKIYLSGRKIGEGLFKNVYECEVCGRVDVRIEGEVNHEMSE